MIAENQWKQFEFELSHSTRDPQEMQLHSCGKGSSRHPKKNTTFYLRFTFLRVFFLFSAMLFTSSKTFVGSKFSLRIMKGLATIKLTISYHIKHKRLAFGANFECFLFPLFTLGKYAWHSDLGLRPQTKKNLVLHKSWKSAFKTSIFQTFVRFVTFSSVHLTFSNFKTFTYTCQHYYLYL